MIVALIAFPIGAVSLGIVGYLLAKHWKEMRLLDPLSIKEEQERQKREEFIHRRFDRLRSDHLEPFKRLGRHVRRSVENVYQSTQERLQAFENLYKKAKSPFAAMAPSVREQMKAILLDARSLVRDLKWAEAERKYLEALSLDARNAEAYRGLGLIYLRQKLYPQAKETFEFLTKIKQADDATYAGLAEIAQAEGNRPLAESMRQKAVEMSPRQAYRHAELAEFYLAYKDAANAWSAAKRATELEPSSAKYLELSLEIAILLGDREEARRRYDRLRLLSEDRTRFQSLREKVEVLEASAPAPTVVATPRARVLRRKEKE